LSIQIRPATDADVPALTLLVNSAYRGDTSRRGWTTEADLLDGIRTSEDQLRELLRNPAATLLCYLSHSALLGCVYLENNAPDLYLGMLTVAPDRQSGGIGKQLLAAAEAHGRALGCQFISMTVISVRHELIAYYERRGFHQTGETEAFPMDDPRFGLPRQPLAFCVMKKALL